MGRGEAGGLVMYFGLLEAVTVSPWLGPGVGVSVCVAMLVVGGSLFLSEGK